MVASFENEQNREFDEFLHEPNETTKTTKKQIFGISVTVEEMHLNEPKMNF